MSADDEEAPGVVDEGWLRRAALHYLERYSASEAHLRRLLERRIRRRAERLGTAMPDAESVRVAIDGVVALGREIGVVDDVAFAAMKVAGARRRGRSAARIAATLAAKGVAEEVARRAIVEHDAEVGSEDGDSELIAALRLAKRRRLGPWRRSGAAAGEVGRDEIGREVATLCRGGFGYGLARKVVEMELEEAEQAIAPRF